MSSITDKVDYLKATKEAIRTAITNKGVSVSQSDTFRSYAEKIIAIPSTGPVYEFATEADIKNLFVNNN